mmetsp:Transcript_19979/g.42992  ORF Transcript_19979/g.42992 Transcript_19979/m.42992 type:complete len:311 (-) Transcript_19979:479-1411(-)
MPSLAHIGTGIGNISRLVGQDLNVGLLSHIGLHQVDKIAQRSSTALAQVENLIRIRPVQRPHDAIANIINVGVIAAAGAVTKLLQGLSTANLVNELEGCHVGSAAGSIDGKEPQAGYIQPIQMMVGVSQQFTGLFGGRIGGHGVVHHFFFGKQGRLGASIDGRRAGKDKVLNIIFGRQFHEARRAFNVGMNVDVGVFNRRPNTGPGGHVHHPLGLFGFKNVRQELQVANVSVINLEAFAVTAVTLSQQVEIGLFDAHVVIIIDFVDNHDAIATVQQIHGHVTADKAGAARHEHRFSFRVGFQRFHGLPGG